MHTEIIEENLTFDEILEDDYYKAEFEKRVQQRLEDINKNRSVGGEVPMDNQVQIPEGEIKQGDVIEQTPATTENPAVENTNKALGNTEETAKEPAREMTAEQFDTYNETLRRISKTAKASLPNRYNAFEDAEVKSLVKQQVMQGDTPNIKELAANVVSRMTSEEKAKETTPSSEKQATADNATEFLELKAENALLKAGIATERLDAAKKLFIAEGATFDKIDEFVAKYPEWTSQERGVVLGKAQPLSERTAPNPGGQPILNDFEARVQELRKARGYK